MSFRPPVQEAYFRVAFRPVPVSKRHVRFLVQLRFLISLRSPDFCSSRDRPKNTARSRKAIFTSLFTRFRCQTSRLNPLRTTKVFAPASVHDPTSVSCFLQFQRLTKKHVATVNPHGQAGPGKLFWPHFSPGSDVKTSRLMARPVQESHFRPTFRLVPMSKRRVWIHYELVRFLVQLRFFGNHGF